MTRRQPPDPSDLFREACRWSDGTYPGHGHVWLVVELATGIEARIPVPPHFGVQTDILTFATEVFPWRHSPDYREVHWHGHRFRFSKTQASVVELLDQARRGEEPAVDQRAILQAVGSDGSRLSDLFRRGDGLRAWGLLIVAGDIAGSYRLADRPPDPPERTAG
jgi:hypothetical protein